MQLLPVSDYNRSLSESKRYTDREPLAFIIFHNDDVFYVWLLVIILEVVDLVYRRIRRGSYQREESVS